MLILSANIIWEQIYWKLLKVLISLENYYTDKFYNFRSGYVRRDGRQRAENDLERES